MGLRALNNPKSSFEDPYANTGKDAASPAPIPVPFSGTGGEVSAGVEPGNGYRYHYWKSNGTFVVDPEYTTAVDIDMLVIAGGGGGGGRAGGGGGAGGIVHGQSVPIPSASAGDTIPVTVGEGGQGFGPGGSGGSVGGDSKFGTDPNPYYCIAVRGGAGGQNNDAPIGGGEGCSPGNVGCPGGSGGGDHVGSGAGEGTQPTQNPGKPWVTNYGNDGCGGASGNICGAGGGAGGAAAFPSPTARGAAGASAPFPDFSVPLFMPAPDPYRPGINPLPGSDYGGGGGAGYYPPNGPGLNMPSSATNGGGGPGAPDSSGASGVAGINGLGGGGGGAGNPNPVGGGNGGDGMVVIRYAV